MGATMRCVLLKTSCKGKHSSNRSLSMYCSRKVEIIQKSDCVQIVTGLPNLSITLF